VGLLVGLLNGKTLIQPIFEYKAIVFKVIRFFFRSRLDFDKNMSHFEMTFEQTTTELITTFAKGCRE